jgi:hypothetical protein
LFGLLDVSTARCRAFDELSALAGVDTSAADDETCHRPEEDDRVPERVPFWR